ncbi:MAG: hypothetical protein AB1644_02835 [Candidatus Zixiibacteriota bacterium]
MGIKKILARYQLGQLRRRVQPFDFNVPADLLKCRHVLICLPNGLRELTLVKQFLPTITYLFGKADVTLLAMPGLQVTDIYPRKGFQLVTPSVDQLGWAGVPKKGFLSMLQGYNIDTVLDLTLESSVFTSTVLLSLPKAIRIGRGNHLGAPYYNLEIKTKFLRDERNIYRSLLEILGEIMNRRVQPLGAGAAN